MFSIYFLQVSRASSVNSSLKTFSYQYFRRHPSSKSLWSLISPCSWCQCPLGGKSRRHPLQALSDSDCILSPRVWGDVEKCWGPHSIDLMALDSNALSDSYQYWLPSLWGFLPPGLVQSLLESMFLYSVTNARIPAMTVSSSARDVASKDLVIILRRVTPPRSLRLA